MSKEHIAYRDAAGVRHYNKASLIDSEEAEQAYRIAEKTIRELQGQEERDE